MTSIRSSKIDRTRLSSSTSSSPRILTCAQTPEKVDVEGMLNSLFFNEDLNCDHLVYTLFVRSISTTSSVFEK